MIMGFWEISYVVAVRGPIKVSDLNHILCDGTKLTTNEEVICSTNKVNSQIPLYCIVGLVKDSKSQTLG